MNDKPRPVPYYAIHSDGKICGFFGNFSFLSNFWELKNGVCLDEMYYPSVEHAYQAAKYPLDQREVFLSCTSGKAKALGKLAPSLNIKKWNAHKFELMSELNWQKFNNNPDVKEMLLLMDGYHLEERNNWGDTWWGTDVNGVGENNLGKILMSIRDKIMASQNKQEYF